MKKTTTHLFTGYALLFLLLIATSGSSLNAQSCNLLSGNFNLGGPTHDPGFQSNDAVNATAALSNGNFVVAWETRDGVDGDGNGAFFQVFNSAGAMVTAVTMPYADVNAAGDGDQGTPGPKVIALTTGFVIGWESENGPGDTGPAGETQQDVFFRVYNNDGSAVTGSTRLSLAAQEDKLEYMLPLSTGGFVLLTSIDEDVIGNNTDDFFFQAFNAMGVSTSGGLVNISGGAHDAAFQSIDQAQAMADLGNGSFVVAWESRDGIDGEGNGAFFRIFNTNGTPVTGVVMPYADINPAGTGDQGTPGPIVLALANGRFIVSWESKQGPGDIGPGTGNNQQDIYFRSYNADGTSGTATTKANSDNTADTEELTGLIRLTGGNFAFLYRTNENAPGNNTDDFFVRTFTSNGLVAGASFEVSSGAHTEVFSAAQQYNLGFVALSNGNFVVGWTARDGADGDGSGVYYRVFNPMGGAVSPVVLPYADINPTGIGDQSPFGPILEALPNGFSVVWHSKSGPGDFALGSADKQDVYHRVIDNNGSPLCGTTKTNAGNEDDEETLLAVQALGNGNFAVVYKDDEDATGNKDDLFVRVIGGAPLQIVCPGITGTVISNGNCVDRAFFLTVTGLQNMAMSANNEQNYGIRFVAFANATSNPYSGGTLIGTVPFGDLTGGGTVADLSNAVVNTVDPDLFIYAILDATPGDAACMPFAQTVIAMNANPVVSISVPDPIFVTNGMPPLNVAGGGLPVGGEYIDLIGETFMDDGNGMTFSFLPNPPVGTQVSIEYFYVDGNGCSDFASQSVTLQNAPVAICPGITGAVISNGNCVDRAFFLTVTGLQNMAMSANNEQNYGIRFVAFANATSNPYSGGTLIGTVPFANLTGGGTIADFSNGVVNTVDPDLFIYAILDATPGDVACMPFAQTVIAMNANPVVSISLPDPIFVTNGMPPLNVAGGGLPVGGVYVDLIGGTFMDDGNGMTFSFLPNPPVGTQVSIEYFYVDGNGCSNIVGQSVTLQNAPVAICPGLGTATVSAPAVCAGSPFNLTVTGLQNMAMSANNEQNYGVRFVAFANATSNPYSGGTLLGTVAFGDLTGGGTVASLTGVTINTVDPDLFIYAILDATPGDVACMPAAQTVIAINALPVVSISLPDTIFVSNGMPPLNVAGGGLPVGGVYTDQFNETMDDGNGETFSFLPNLFVGDTNVITYTYTDVNGCVASASQTIFVANAPVGVDDPETLQIKIFPNPTSGIIHIQGLNADRIEVMDVHGRVLSGENHPDSVLDISNLPGGIYFLRVMMGDRMAVVRIVRE